MGINIGLLINRVRTGVIVRKRVLADTLLQLQTSHHSYLRYVSPHNSRIFSVDCSKKDGLLALRVVFTRPSFVLSTSLKKPKEVIGGLVSLPKCM
jgi:hypothetical protein